MREDKDIYEVASDLQEQYNRYYPERFSEWSKPRLEQFDAEAIGTIASLQERRREYEEELKASHGAYRDALRLNQMETMRQFKEKLALWFFDRHDLTVPESVSDRVFARAYDEGHSSGFRDVVTEYGELSSLVYYSILDYKYNQD